MHSSLHGKHHRHHPRALVSWNFTTTFFFAAPGQPFPAGSSTLARIVYDPTRVRANGDVRLVGHQHFLGPAG